MKGLHKLKIYKTRYSSEPISPKRKAKICRTTELYKLFTQIVRSLASSNLMKNLREINMLIRKIILFRGYCNKLYADQGDQGHRHYIFILHDLADRVFRLGCYHNLKDRVLVCWGIENMWA